MVSGPLRTVLWILGSLGVLWIVLALASAVGIGGTMGGGMPADPEGGMTGPGMMGGGSVPGVATGAVWGAMVVQTLGMLGLAGVFVYLVVDAFRSDGSPTAEARGRDPE